MVLLGTRPEIIKLAPLIDLLEKDNRFKLTLVNSGQHYDTQLSSIFFKGLQLPKPHHNLEVGSGTHGEQTGQIIMAAETLLLKYKPKIVLAQGDTNTVMATSLAAVKTHIPFGHVEAGLRSFDRSMPEELNRIIADHSSELHLAPTEGAAINLLLEGCSPKTIHITGNTIVDAVLQNRQKARQQSKIVDQLNLSKRPFAVVTIHRPANVDNKRALSSIITAFLQLTELHLVIPLHPRTMHSLKRMQLLKQLIDAPNIQLAEPLGYLDFLQLMDESDLIITDSGGLQEEAVTLGKPCVTLRTNTERPESVKIGANFLVGRSPPLIIKTVRKILSDESLPNRISNQKNPFGDGHASERTIKAIAEFCETGRPFEEPHLLKTGTLEKKLHSIDKNLNGLEVLYLEKQYGWEVLLIYDQKGYPVYPAPKRKLFQGERVLLSIRD